MSWRIPSLHAKLLCKSRLYIVASPVYAQKHGLPKNAAELSSHTLLGFSQPAHLNTWPIQLEDEPLTIQAKIKCSNGETVRQLALQGAGIACLSRFMVEQDIQDGRFIALLEDQIQIERAENTCGLLSTELCAKTYSLIY